MEDTLYEIASMRLVAGLPLDKAIPDHSTILKFCHLLEQHGLARHIFEEVYQSDRFMERRLRRQEKNLTYCLRLADHYNI
ncbi:hypothetical protein GCM10011352_40830 [Marinobacterium zhoushanense]|uniref:DDE family transposase n=1 Tax=Marinobacterium zhoushanense TaxID=1679163 RepID=A0ABQ1KYC6_9GAMM|nr:hypothetical protein GCM10011352_40830 [Marinobacterium zhoushanense]